MRQTRVGKKMGKERKKQTNRPESVKEGCQVGKRLASFRISRATPDFNS